MILNIFMAIFIIYNLPMQNCISYISLAPVRYLNRLNALQKTSWTMKGSQEYPAFPLSFVAAYLSVIGLSIFMLVYFITNDQHQCYQNIRIGVIILAAVYPIQATAIFICTIGSAAISQAICWKYMISILLGLIVSGFSFGGLGFVYLCILNQQYPILIQVSFLSSNTFIQIIVYTYLIFIGLYIILIPILTCAFHAQDNPNPAERGCCYTFCCVIYVIFQIIFVTTAIFVILLKLFGVPLLIYVLVEITRAQLQNSYTSQSVFYALTIIAICLPPVVFFVIYLITNCCCCCGTSQQIQGEDQTKKQDAQLADTGRQIAFLGTEPSKGFDDKAYDLGNSKL